MVMSGVVLWVYGLYDIVIGFADTLSVVYRSEQYAMVLSVCLKHNVCLWMYYLLFGFREVIWIIQIMIGVVGYIRIIHELVGIY